MVSNGDDNNWSGAPINALESFNKARNELELFTEAGFSRKNGQLSSEYLYRAESLRFLSLVNKTQKSCPQVGGKYGARYIAMSSHFYNTSGGQSAVDRMQPDSFDLCSNNLGLVFSSIESSIKNILQGHRYNYWKVSGKQPKDFEPSKLKVFKFNPGQKTKTRIPENPTNGFTFSDQFYQAQNTRYFPCKSGAVCEPASGYLIKLNGTGRVTYPECIYIEKTEPTRYFGYIDVPAKPLLDPLPIVTINGSPIPQYDPAQPDAPSWKFMEEWEFGSKVIEIQGPNNFDRVENGEARTGYFF